MPVRLVADKLTTLLNQPVVVENRTGGAGRIGVSAVINSPADGLTFLYTPFAAVTIFPLVYKTLDYDPFTQLRPVSQLCTFDFAMAVSNSVPAKTPKDLVAWLKANPGQGAVRFARRRRVAALLRPDVWQGCRHRDDPYWLQGRCPRHCGSPGRPDSDGVIDCERIHRPAQGRQAARDRDVGCRASLGYTDVPTFKESGFDIVGTSWYAMFAPAKTPDDRSNA